MQSIAILTEKDKSHFYQSLYILKEGLESFVQTFYKYLLQTEAAELFHLLDMEKQYKMFRVSIAMIISHVDNPLILDKHLKFIVEGHQNYGLKQKHIEMFLSSFTCALEEIFMNDWKSVQIWKSIMSEIMFTFEELMNFD